MKRLKTSKEEIIYLLNSSIEKYKTDTGQQIVVNTNRKNYEALAVTLSVISNQLPEKWQEWGTEEYTPSLSEKDPGYPYRKYDITGGQIKDALSGIVSNPRSFLVDACYVYLYGMGRKAFEKNPVDENLVEATKESKLNLPGSHEVKQLELNTEIAALKEKQSAGEKRITVLSVLFGISIIALVAALFFYINDRNKFAEIRKDMSVMPYQPTQAEIDSLEGIWLCYTGSPQARSSDPNRYHLVVSNVLDVKYKNGYFTFNRYGASFDHAGYMQYEAPWLVSIYSYVRNASGQVESPRHSLMRLDKEKDFIPVISASWNFDAGDKNSIIGIREVYIKQGKNGDIEEVLNTRENVGCHCKIVKWKTEGNSEKMFYLKNEMLDTLPYPSLKNLINENSIILRSPDQSLIIRKDSTGKIDIN